MKTKTKMKTKNLLRATALSLLTLIGAHAAAAAPPHPEAAASPPAPAAAPSGEARTTPGVVNLNDASPEQLALLPGVGPSRALAIVNYRKLHPFKHLEELQKIKGIGKKTYARLRPLVALSGPTTLTGRPGRT
jgi:competence protein ComEA